MNANVDINGIPRCWKVQFFANGKKRYTPKVALSASAGIGERNEGENMKSESMFDLSEAFQACRERDCPIIINLEVDDSPFTTKDILKVFPSGHLKILRKWRENNG